MGSGLTMISRIILLLSIGLNTYFIFLTTSNTPNLSDLILAESKLAKSGDKNELITVTEFDQLIAVGLEEKQVKVLLLDQWQHDQITTTGADIYWQSDRYGGKAESLRKKIENERALRKKLVSQFSQSAISDPVFKRLFRPLSKTADFLKSEDQILLHETMIRRQIDLFSGSSTAVAGPSLMFGKPPIRIPARPLSDHSDIDEVLDEKAAFEYKLRNSYLADKLRQSDIVFTESSFRQAYRVLGTTYNNPNLGPDDGLTVIVQRDELKQTLGDDIAIKLFASLDQRFELLKIAGEQQSLSEEQILYVYGVISDNEAAMIEAYWVRKSDPELGLQLITAASRNREAQLNNYLGREATQELLTTFSNSRMKAIKR